jgi:tRNA(fMet)-specific endonuclease VapC
VNYFLDTNAVIALLKNQPAGVRGRLRRVVSRGASIAVSSVVLYELWYGVARSERRRDNAERLRIFLSGKIDVVPFDEQDAVTAGDLRATLEAAGTPIGPYDLLIAAQALWSRATLVTANISEFARVRGLVWQDWTAAALFVGKSTSSIAEPRPSFGNRLVDREHAISKSAPHLCEPSVQRCGLFWIAPSFQFDAAMHFGEGL